MVWGKKLLYIYSQQCEERKNRNYMRRTKVKFLKKSSILLIIISSIGIIISQALMLYGVDFSYNKVNGVSFLGLGIGLILFGIYILKKTNRN